MSGIKQVCDDLDKCEDRLAWLSERSLCVWQDGTYILCDGPTREYENDENYLLTIALAPIGPLNIRQRDIFPMATDADLDRPTRTVTLPSGRIYRMSVVREPELFICNSCGEWTDDSDPCCGVGASTYEFEVNDER